ncbi:hypothetical protein Pelo_17146 [Pelomyxa schiedti]|nr:hypothetical protein Pelo_17146 [Pelomyxa schiedti]
MRFSVDGMWRQSSGLTHTQLSSHILRGSWIKCGSSQRYLTNTEALCTMCNLDDGVPVEITLWSLPDFTSSFGALSHSKEVFTFNLIPKCSSSRAHLHSHIVFQVNTIPGIPSFSSNPISLCARERHKNGLKLIRSRNTQVHSRASSVPTIVQNPIDARPPAELLNEFQPSRGKPVRITHSQTHPAVSEITSLSTSSNRQFIVDSRVVPRLPESTIAAIPERVIRRPAIFVTIMWIKDENLYPLVNAMSSYSAALDFWVQYTKIANNLYVTTTKHKSVENFCYSSYALCWFLQGNNPFHVDLTQPNHITTIVGWANNTFSQG